MRISRKVAIAATTGVAVLAGSGVAVAFWTTSSSGVSAPATTSALGVPAAVSTSAVSASNVTINVTAAPASGPTPTGYRVARTSPSPSTSVCTITGSTGSCNDGSPVTSATNNYSVYAKLAGANWEALTPATTFAVVPSTDTTAPNAPVITFPVSGTSYNTAGWTGTLTGTAADNTGGSGIQKTQVAVQQAGVTGTKYWDSSTSSFSSSSVIWMDATSSGTGNVNWSRAFARPADGSYSVQARSFDVANNTGSTATSSFSIDTQAPSTPSVTVPTVINNANKTSVGVSGFAEKSSAVSITASDGGTPRHNVTATATADASTGAYSATLDLHTLSDGTVSYVVTATDASGNTSGNGTATDTKDTVAPGSPTIATVPNYVNVANNNSVAVSGTAEAGSSIALTVTDAGAAHTVTASAAANGSGSWSVNVNLSSLNDGTVTYSATASDAAGNTSGAGSASDNKDTAAPNPPAGLTLSAASDTGKSSTDGITKNNKPTFIGSAEANATVTIYNGATALASGSADAGGAFSITLTTALSDGSYSITAKATDAAGNQSAASSAKSVTIDTAAPAAPVLATPTYYTDGSGSNGAGAADKITLTAETGATITITENKPTSTNGPYTGTGAGASAVTVQVDTVNGSSQNPAPYDYSITATDAAGNTSTATAATGTDNK